MPEDPDFGDIDDAQLEAAMAALLGTSPSAPPEPEAPSTIDAGADREVDPEISSGPDLDVSPWAPVATGVAADMSLAEAGFDSPLHAALGDLADINSDTFSSPPPPADPLRSPTPAMAGAPSRSRFAAA